MVKQSAIALVSVLVISTTASAQSGKAPAAPAPLASEPEVFVQDYRLQLVAADLSWFLLGLATADKDLPYIPVIGYLGFAPGVHLAHGNYGRGLGSAALRIGLPFLGGLIGADSASCASDVFCALGGYLIGGAIGIGAAVLTDWLLLGRVEKKALFQAGGVLANPTFAISPHGGVSLGLAGSW